MHHLCPPAWRLAPLALTAALLGSAPAAHADGNPWALGAQLAVGHDSNVLRTPAAQAQADTTVSAGVRLNLDQPFGRERLVLSGSLDRNHFQRYSDLDNTSYGLPSRLDFEAGDRLFGNVALDASQQAFNFDPSGGSARTALNQERNTRLALRLRQGVVTRLTLEGGAELQRRSESDPLFDYRALDRNAADVGVRYQYNPDLSVGGLLRYADGRYPSVGNDFTRSDLEAFAAWQVSGASNLDLRLTASHVNNSLSTVRDGSLWSGAVRWRWVPSGKTSLSLRVARDSDTGSNDVNLLGTALTFSDARVRTSLDLQGSWLASAKLRLDGQLSASRRRLDASLQALSDTSGHDTTKVARLTLSYQPLRNLETGCSLSREQRTTSGDVGSLSYPYAATVYSCYALAWLR